MTPEGLSTPQPHPEPTAEGGAPRPPAPMAPRGPRPSYGGGRPSYGGGGGGGGRGAGGPGGPRRPRRKGCSFCVGKGQKIGYKERGRIRRYNNEGGQNESTPQNGPSPKESRVV